MTPDEYQLLAMRTECDQVAAAARMVPENDASLRNIRLNHAVIGLMGEVGELAGAVEKHVYYGRPFDVDNVREEIGDCLWYLAQAVTAIGYDLESLMRANISKLAVRYPEKYTEGGAPNRDYSAEANAVKEMTDHSTYFPD